MWGAAQSTPGMLVPTGSDRENRIFAVLLFSSLLLFSSAGIYLKRHNPPPQTLEQRITGIRTRLVLPEVKHETHVARPKTRRAPEVVEPDQPVDLTRKPPPGEQSDEAAERPPVERRPVRRVYGLRRVYSTGIGAGGAAADAVVGKFGNTLDTEIDTFTASDSELVGQIVSMSGVDKPPRLVSRSKPEYTPEMIANRVEGVIRGKVLVDADGRVKRVVVLDDLGYGSREKARDAFLKLEFEPATRDGAAMAVWIIVSFRFEMLDS